MMTTQSEEENPRAVYADTARREDTDAQGGPHMSGQTAKLDVRRAGLREC